MTPSSRKTQRARILRILIDAHGAWVPLPEVLALGIAQYNSRILELRRAGFNIENRIEGVDGTRHSWFQLLASPAAPAPKLVKEKTPPADSAAMKSRDWYERETGKTRPSGDNSDLPLFAGCASE